MTKINFTPIYIDLGQYNLTIHLFWQLEEKDYYGHRIDAKDGYMFSVYNITGKPLYFIQLKDRKYIIWDDDGVLKRCIPMDHETTANLPHAFLAK